jgi:hypothetical protein
LLFANTRCDSGVSPQHTQYRIAYRLRYCDDNCTEAPKERIKTSCDYAIVGPTTELYNCMARRPGNEHYSMNPPIYKVASDTDSNCFISLLYTFGARGLELKQHYDFV